MKAVKFLIDFAAVFAIVFVVNAIVVYLWNLLRHGQGAFDWEITFFFAITLGIALPWVERMQKKEGRAAGGTP